MDPGDSKTFNSLNFYKMGKMIGYNIVLRTGTGPAAKLFAGTTSNTFNLTAKVKESITKEDHGTTNSIVTGYDTEMTVDGVMELNEEEQKATRADREDIMEMVMAGNPVDFVYGDPASKSTVRKGKMILTSYSETTDAEGEATYSLSCKVITKLEKEVNS